MPNIGLSGSGRIMATPVVTSAGRNSGPLALIDPSCGRWLRYFPSNTENASITFPGIPPNWL